MSIKEYLKFITCVIIPIFLVLGISLIPMWFFICWLGLNIILKVIIGLIYCLVAVYAIVRYLDFISEKIL